MKKKHPNKFLVNMNSLLNTTSSPSSSSTSQQIPLHHHHMQQIQTGGQHHHFGHDPTSAPPPSNDDFLDHMLASIPPSSWSELTDSNHNNNNTGNDGGEGFPGFDESAVLAAKLRQHQITPGGAAVAKLMFQQQLLMAAVSAGGGDVLLDGSSFNSPPSGGEGSVQALFNGFSPGSQQNFRPPQAQNFGMMSQQQQQHQPPQPQGSGSNNGGAGGSVAAAAGQQPKQRVRARRGQATDPHSIAERLRRERIADRMKALQELVPNANKTDKASMLDEIIDYVKFLQLQVKVLSMSRLGGAAAVAPLVADLSSERAGGAQSASSAGDNNLTMTEHQVAKLMEEDMGSAMQYLQGKGLCLMPISLATAISTATCHVRTPLANNNNNGESNGPPSPNMSVSNVPSAGAGDGTVKNSAVFAVSKS